MTQKNWTSAFRNSPHAPVTYRGRPSARSEIRRALDHLGYAVARSSRGMYSPSFAAARVLDGFWISLNSYGMYGEGSLGSGSWVVGTNPLRLLIDELGLAPPRRLKGETRVPSGDELRRWSEKQAGEPEDVQIEAARTGLGVQSAEDLARLVWSQFGAQVFPPAERWEGHFPGLDGWGELGLAEWVRQALADRVESAEQAGRWRRLILASGREQLVGPSRELLTFVRTFGWIPLEVLDEAARRGTSLLQLSFALREVERVAAGPIDLRATARDVIPLLGNVTGRAEAIERILPYVDQLTTPPEPSS